MMKERFFQIVEAYGASPERWPAAEREAAEAFAATHPDLAGPVLAEARALDGLLGGADTEISELLERRILRSMPMPREQAAPRWAVPVAVAAALLVGVFIGFASGALTVDPENEVDAIYAEAFAGLDEDWVDWLGGDA